LIFFLLFLWRLLLLLRAAIFFDLKGRSQSVSTSFLAIRSAMVGLAWLPSNIAIYRYEKGVVVRGTPKIKKKSCFFSLFEPPNRTRRSLHHNAFFFSAQPRNQPPS
jgi:hypothetical protein